ncbi:cilia- and flagella-associated protein 410 [Pocillopora verrucosa]|uniref:cilia- and flagella-associated protein 410 n=1 Tax=Pocillopora verrucosa TaxID=203993 RepID=UPI00333E3F5E
MSRLTEQQILSRARASSLENVKNLNFWGSDLSDISVLRQMPNVEVLSLSVNNISSLEDFAHCPRLRELYLRKNSIEDISEIGCLKNLPKLRVLWLSDNPCANVEHYRMTVLKNLPKLTKLDTVVVEESEVEEAAKEGTEIKTPDEIPVHNLELTATVGKDALKTVSALSEDANQQVSTEKGDPESAQSNLVNETNKLRAQLGLKPLMLDDQTHGVTTMAATDSHRTEPVTVSPTPRSQNILSAVLTLVQELDHTSLLTLRQEIDQQLQDRNDDVESKPYSENKHPPHEKEAMVD